MIDIWSLASEEDAFRNQIALWQVRWRPLRRNDTLESYGILKSKRLFVFFSDINQFIAGLGFPKTMNKIVILVHLQGFLYLNLKITKIYKMWSVVVCMFQYVFAGVNRRICLRTNKASFVFVVERVFSKSNRTIAVSGLFHGTSLGLSPKILRIGQSGNFVKNPAWVERTYFTE